VLELGEAEYMVRASGYLQSLDDFRPRFRSRLTDSGIPVRLADVARIQLVRKCARGIAELDGGAKSRAALSSCVSGKNALETIEQPQANRASVEPARPGSARSCTP